MNAVILLIIVIALALIGDKKDKPNKKKKKQPTPSSYGERMGTKEVTILKVIGISLCKFFGIS